MNPLVANIIDDLRDNGSADAENTVSILPTKSTQILEFVMDPLRRLTLQKLRDVARCPRRFGHYKSVDVIFNSTDLHRRHLVILRDASDVRPDPLLDIGEDEPCALFCAEHQMVETLGVCIRHLFRASLTRRVPCCQSSVG